MKIGTTASALVPSLSSAARHDLQARRTDIRAVREPEKDEKVTAGEVFFGDALAQVTGQSENGPPIAAVPTLTGFGPAAPQDKGERAARQKGHGDDGKEFQAHGLSMHRPEPV